MEWLNSNTGILIVIFSILIIAAIALCVCLLFNLRKKIAVQKLKFTGLYSIDTEDRSKYASLMIGNKSINDLSLAELGIQNGKINFELTAEYKKQNEISNEARMVIEQRSAISFKLSCDELKKLVYENNGKKVLKTLRLYAIDLTGTVYRGKIASVKKLLAEILAEEKAEATEKAEPSKNGQQA